MPDTCMPMKGGHLDNNGYECPVHCPASCGKDMMSCVGGDEGNGCMIPDFCISTIGELGKDGNECVPMCPQKCSPDQMSCWGGKDGNDCPMPDICIPMKGGPVGKDGMECPVMC